MKKSLILLAAGLLLAFAACTEKEQDPIDNPNVTDTTGDNTETDPFTAFVGTYDLTIVTDSVQNQGVWFLNSTLPASTRIPTRSGRLTITKVDANTLQVLGRISIAGDSVDYYRTTATLDADGKVQFASGEDYESYYGPKHFTFTAIPIENNESFTFKADASYQFNGGTMIERSTNTATKRK